VDLGDVASVAQIGPPPTVASLKQRIGRSGRRPGQPQILRQYVVLDDIKADSEPADRLRLLLIQTIAAVELMLDGCFEPPNLKGDLHCSTLVQQVLSVIAQRHGASAGYLFRLLCTAGPFTDIDAPRFQMLLRGMAETGALEQLEDGTLMPGIEGEHLLAGYDIYTAFAVPEEYRLISAGRPLGTLPLSVPALVGSLIVFGGRRWKIESVDAPSRTLTLVPAPSGRPPRFGGAAVGVSSLIRHKMREILASNDMPAYLDSVAQAELLAARSEFRAMGLDVSDLYTDQASTWIAIWAGDAAISTLRLALERRGIRCEADDAFLKVTGDATRETLDVLAQIQRKGLPSLADLLSETPSPPEQKFDAFVAGRLLSESFGVRHLDRDEAHAALTKVLARIGTFSKGAAWSDPYPR
jgi:ATP-dependent Lhr-like helicase